MLNVEALFFGDVEYAEGCEHANQAENCAKRDFGNYEKIDVLNC